MTFTEETNFDFDFTYTPGEPADYDYPGSGAEVKITAVRLNGVKLPYEAITQAQYEQMIEQVLDTYY